VGEIRGLASQDGRQSSPAGEEIILKKPAAGYLIPEPKTMKEQYSQTGTLGKAEGDVPAKKIIGSKLNSCAKDEYHSNRILQRPRAIPPRAPEG
jgi:hypothetical protein